MPSIAATTTGMYSGLQPAITALMATFSAVTETERWAMNPTSCLPSSRAASSIAPTRSSVGGMTGRPSVHPCAKQNSMASPTSATLWRLDVSVTDMRASLTGHTLPPGAAGAQAPVGRLSLLDAHGDRARRAERRDDRGVLAGAARDDDHQVVRAGAESHLVREQPIPEARGVDHGEALTVLRAEAVEPDAGTLPDRPLDVRLGPASRRKGLSVLGPEDDERLAAQIDVVAPRRRRRAGDREQERFGGRRAVIVDVVGRLGAAHGDAALGRPEAALDMERRPRRRRLVLGDAVRVLTGVAEGRAVLASRPRATDILEGQAHRAPDHGVGAVALAERVGAGVDPESRRDRAVADEERGARMRSRLDRVEVEARIGERTDCGDDDRQMLGQGARERRVDGDRLEGCHSLARYERHDHLGAVAGEAPEDASHALLGRREHGQPVRPTLGDGEVLERVEIARRGHRADGGHGCRQRG